MTGILLASSFIFLGDIVDRNNEESIELADVLVPVYQFAGIFVLSAVFAFLERYCLSTYAGWFGIDRLDLENLARHLREKYIYALLHHDIDYIESNKPSTLGQAVAEESSRIINGLGPSIGRLVRSISTFIGGVIVGVMHVLLCLFFDVVELAADSVDSDRLSLFDLCWATVWKGDGKLDPNADA